MSSNVVGKGSGERVVLFSFGFGLVGELSLLNDECEGSEDEWREDKIKGDGIRGRVKVGVVEEKFGVCLIWAENWVVVRRFFIGHRALREHHGWKVFADFGPARFNRVRDRVKRAAKPRCLEERVD